ncbi:MAG: universal stress protein [Bryobacteraceae bacterium]
MKVLFTTDGSPEASDAAAAACGLLNLGDIEADAVCVVPEYLPAACGWNESRVRERYMERMEAETNRILSCLVSSLAVSGVPANPLVEQGSPAGSIVELAAGYDLVVLGASGKRHASHVRIGAVANQVASHAPCSVLIGRPTLRTNGPHILAAVDASMASRRAMMELPRFVAVDSAEITLMHVIETPWLHLGLEQEWFGYEDPEHEQLDPDSRWRRRLCTQAERIIERARDALASPHAGVERKIVEGLPVREILGEAEVGDHDLVVVGATGATDLKHQVLGSVSLDLAANAQCSVLIVRSPR